MGNAQKKSTLQKYDHLMKVALIGDAMVGKTCAISKYVNDMEAYEKQYTPTIGTDFKFKIVNHDNKTVKLQIWDWAGKERYRPIDYPPSCKDVHGYLLFYDVTNCESFKNINLWNDKINENSTNHQAVKILVGSKCDLYDKRQVSYKQGEELSNNLGTLFMETSMVMDDKQLNPEVVEGYLRKNRNMLFPKDSIYNIPELVIQCCLSYVGNNQSVDNLFKTLIEAILKLKE